MREEIISIAKDRRKLDTLSQGAIERAKDYLWSVKGKQMAKIVIFKGPPTSRVEGCKTHKVFGESDNKGRWGTENEKQIRELRECSQTGRSPFKAVT